MRIVIDIEANSLVNPTQVWLIVCKNVDTGELHVFRSPTSDVSERERFLLFARDVEKWIGHNFLDYDYPVLHRLVGLDIADVAVHAVDTLILSRLIDYSREGGHSIEQYGKEIGLEKGHFSDWKSGWSQEMEDYCVRDVDICLQIYNQYRRTIDDRAWAAAIGLEQRFQLIVNLLSSNGFYFDTPAANQLLAKVEKKLQELDEKIKESFPPREVVIREFTPKETKYGTINRTSVPRSLWHNIHNYTIGNTYQHTRLEEFNPDSHKQRVEVLNAAGWKPIEKTNTHIEVEREIQHLKYKKKDAALDTQLEELYNRLQQLRATGWKINETNLLTLPASAPASARTLAQRILYESRRRSLTEWISLVDPDTKRIHGSFYGIGAWTHRMAHQRPNTANIPNEYKEDGTVKLLGKECRSLWCAPPGRLLVGVDADSIQLRIFAHIIDDKELINRIVNGNKANNTDPHNYTRHILGTVCKTRQAAKRFLYALFLGAGIGRLAQILDCSEGRAREALDRFLQRYPGYDYCKREIIPADAKRGYFIGLDGRKVPIPGDTVGERRHLCMSGYLQNGEAIIVKAAAVKTVEELSRVKDLTGPVDLVNVVHDEVIFEVPENMALAQEVGDHFCRSIEQVGIDLKLKCPLKGDAKIGKTWYAIH